MYAKVHTAVLRGISAESATVEADLAPGLPGFHIVGLADLSVREAKERIRAALVNEGCRFPSRRITVNLAPAGIRKEGTHFDLPIAVSVLAAAERISRENLSLCAFVGELSLDGTVNRVDGALPLLMGLREMGHTHIFLPAANMEEAMLLKNIMVYPVSSLGEIIRHFDGTQQLTAVEAEGRPGSGSSRDDGIDYSDVKGQESVKRAITAAAAGAHGILLLGPPGVGKTMVSRRIPGILPELTYEEQLEVTKIYSVAGKLSAECPIVTERPFRAPHYSLSPVSFAGGGIRPKPGEISLAHRGVLFLDEFPEYQRKILEFLRTPLEEGEVTINRAGGTVTFPAEFMLAAAMNPCKCGYYGDDTHRCTCTEQQIRNYMGKLSGPLLDRIDIHVEMMPMDYSSLEEEETMAGGNGRTLSSADMREQVAAARAIQRRRYTGRDLSYNSELTPKLIKKFCLLSKPCESLMKEAFYRYRMSARARDRALRVARTIADLSGSSEIGEEHLAEALRYRCLDRLYGGGE